MSVPAAYLGAILTWSTTPLAIQWSSEGGGFLFGVAARMWLGALLCLALAGLFSVPLPRHQENIDWGNLNDTRLQIRYRVG